MVKQTRVPTNPATNLAREEERVTASMLSTYAYTPGPWDYVFSNNSNLILIETPLEHPLGGGIHIASLAGKKNSQTQANARLIAAGPELLEACDMVQRAYVGDGIDMSRAVDACLLAIAKATNRPDDD